MAGIQGMATPKSVGTTQQTTPQLPPQPVDVSMPVQSAPIQAPAQASAASPQGADSIDYDALASQYLDKHTSANGEIDYDGLAKDMLDHQEQASKQSPVVDFYDKMLNTLGPTEKAIASTAVKAVTGTINAPAAILKAVADKVETGQGDIGQEVINSYKNPAQVPSMAESIGRIAPSTKDFKLKRNVIEEGKYPPGMEPLIPIVETGGKQELSDISGADALGLAGELVSGEAVMKGVVKATEVASLAARGISGIAEARQAAKIAKAAETGADMAAKVAPKIDVAAEEAKDMMGLVDELTNAGIVKKVEGFDVPVMPSQVNLRNPNVKAQAEYLSDHPDMLKFILQQEKQTDDMLQGVFEELSPAYNRRVAPQDIPLPNIISESLKQEAELFTATRQKAYKMGKDRVVDVTDFARKIDEVAQELGINVVNPKELVGSKNQYGQIVRRAQVDALPTFGVEDKQEWLRSMRNRGWSNQYSNQIYDKLIKLKELMQADSQGVVRVPFGKIASEYSSLKRDVNALWKEKNFSHNNFRIEMTQLKNGMQEAYDNGVGVILGGEEQAKYMEQVSKYSKIKSVVGDISKIADNEIGSAALARWAFQNVESLSGQSRVEGLKALTELTGNKSAWDNIVSSFLNSEVRKASKTLGKSNVIEWNKVFKRIDDLDPKVQEMLFGKEVNLGIGYSKLGVQVLKDVGAFYDAIQRGTPEAFAATKKAQALKINGVKGIVTSMADNAMGNMLANADKDAKIAEWLTKEGIDDVLKVTPVSERSFLQSKITEFKRRAIQAQRVKNGQLK